MAITYFPGNGLDNAIDQSRLKSSGEMGKDSGVFRLFLVSLVLMLGSVWECFYFKKERQGEALNKYLNEKEVKK